MLFGAKSALCVECWQGWGAPVWEFRKIRGTLFWGPYNKDPTI